MFIKSYYPSKISGKNSSLWK